MVSKTRSANFWLSVAGVVASVALPLYWWQTESGLVAWIGPMRRTRFLSSPHTYAAPAVLLMAAGIGLVVLANYGRWWMSAKRADLSKQQ